MKFRRNVFRVVEIRNDGIKITHYYYGRKEKKEAIKHFTETAKKCIMFTGNNGMIAEVLV